MSDRARTLLAISMIVACLAAIVGVLATDDPSASDRAQALAERLKCPVCASESIAESPSDLARDLRDLIDEQIAEGWTDTQIIDFFVATYGEDTLLDPPAGGRTALLWVAPLLVLVGGVAVILTRRRRGAVRDLTTEERLLVERALKEDQQ